jgi:hypothetical protein
LRLGGKGASGIVGVDRADRLDEQDRCLPVGAWAVLDTARDDEELAGVKVDLDAALLNRQVTVEDGEEVVGCQYSSNNASFSARLTFSFIRPADGAATTCGKIIAAGGSVSRFTAIAGRRRSVHGLLLGHERATREASLPESTRRGPQPAREGGLGRRASGSDCLPLIATGCNHGAPGDSIASCQLRRQGARAVDAYCAGLDPMAKFLSEPTSLDANEPRTPCAGAAVERAADAYG